MTDLTSLNTLSCWYAIGGIATCVPRQLNILPDKVAPEGSLLG